MTAITPLLYRSLYRKALRGGLLMTISQPRPMRSPFLLPLRMDSSVYRRRVDRAYNINTIIIIMWQGRRMECHRPGVAQCPRSLTVRYIISNSLRCPVWLDVRSSAQGGICDIENGLAEASFPFLIRSQDTAWVVDLVLCRCVRG